MTPEQSDFCAGVSLLYMSDKITQDEYTSRMFVAMEVGDVEEMKHVSALMLVLMYGREGATQELRDLSVKWEKLFEVQAA